MIRTAEEILINIHKGFSGSDFGLSGSKPEYYPKLAIIQAINEARIEAVKECAEVVAIDGEWVTNDLGNEIQVFGTLDKQSILKLIDQIK